MNFQRLHVGCGRSKLNGFINADLYPTESTDLVFDLMKPWPIRDDTIQDFYASHVLEHLPDPQFFFRELHRVMMPNGQVLLRVPYGACRMGMADITHLRPWYAESFCWLQPGYSEANKNPQHDTWKSYFGIGLIQLRLNHLAAKWVRNWLGRHLFFRIIDYFHHAFIDELHVHMFALKKPSAVAEYLKTHNPCTVGCAYTIWDFILKGEPYDATKGCKLVELAGTELNYGG